MQFPRALTSYLPATASLFQSRTDWSWCRQATVGGASRGRGGRGLRGTEGEGDPDTGRKWRTTGWEKKERSQREKVRMWKNGKQLKRYNQKWHLPLAAPPRTAHRPKAVQDPGLWATKEKKGCFFSFFLFYELAVRAYRTPHIPLNEHCRPGISSDASEM